MKSISIILPSLNEEKGIVSVLDEIPRKKLEERGYKIEILVVDGLSEDKTRQIANKKGVRVILERRRGYGKAYKTGFKHAKGDIIVTSDADASYPIKDIFKFIEMIEKEDIDFITTNRFANFEKDAMKFGNLIGNKILTIITRLLFNLDIKDSQSGMWIFRSSILPKLNLTSDGMSFSEEIKIEVMTNGFKCKEVPIKYSKRIGKVKLDFWKDGLENLTFLFKKRFLAAW